MRAVGVIISLLLSVETLSTNIYRKHDYGDTDLHNILKTHTHVYPRVLTHAGDDVGVMTCIARNERHAMVKSPSITLEEEVRR